MLTRIPIGDDDEIIVCRDVCFAVIETCVECGTKFLRGIFPQSRCDICSRKQPPHVWENIKSFQDRYLEGKWCPIHENDLTECGCIEGWNK